MRKANGTRTPKLNGKTVALSKTNTVGFIDNPPLSKAHTDAGSSGQDQPSISTPATAPNQLPDEDELMGGSGSGTKSDVMDKNLLQMFDVLRHRLGVLKEAATTRAMLSNEDTNKNSDRMSEQAPKIIDEFDEVIPRSLRDIKMATLQHKDNLVASDNVYIDPYHLTFSKTKVQTEAAKNLEGMLEDSFGNANMRETKNKKSKTTNQTEKSKKSEQLKNEAKRQNRMKLERKLTQNMDQFLTRSVMDSDLRFEAPILVDASPDWPVTIKWCARDPRSKAAENVEGEFDPDLLLRYSLERITLPSGRRLFSYLVRQPVIQRYFVYLFWLVKVKFFESDNIEDSEAYLLRLLAGEYRHIVELMAQRAHAEHEKDFAFKYLPFILANGVYFGFYYVFPGSRHIYTKGFKKTIYMQIIQVMHGIQMCPSSVRVAWAKLFPEDTHEDGEEAEEGGESFPVLLAVKGPRSAQKTSTASHSGSDNDDNSSAASRSASLASSNSNSNSRPAVLKTAKSMAKVRAGWSFDAGTQQEEGSDDGDADEDDAFGDEDGQGDDARVVDVDRIMDGSQNSVLLFNDNHSQYSTPSAEGRFHRPNLARGHVKGGFLSDMQPDFGGPQPHHHSASHFNVHRPKVANHDSFVKAAQRRSSGALPHTASASASALQNEGLIRKLTKRGSSMHLERSATVTAQALAAMALNKPQPAPAHIQHLARAVSSADLHPSGPPTLPGASGGNLKTASSASAANLKAPLPPVRAMSTLKEEKDREKGKEAEKGKPKSPNLKTTEGIASRLSSPTVGTRPSSASLSTYAQAARNPGKHTVQGLAADPVVLGNLHRTYLKPLAERPHRQRQLAQRQNVYEAMDAHAESPQMQLYLFDAAGAKPAAHSHIQAFHRTIPISWCAAGGADTHHKITIATDLHAEISAKLRRSEQELAHNKTEHHKEKIRAVVDTKAALSKVLASGPTNISRFSLDLIRRHRSNNKEAPPPAVEDVVAAVDSVVQQQPLGFYTDEELQKILAEI